MSYFEIGINDELPERGVLLSEMCDACNREATVFNFEGSFCELHGSCLECGDTEAPIKRHCFDCWGSMICEEDWVAGKVGGMKEGCYGFPCVENPHDFTPDEECCTPEEVAFWEDAKKRWDAGETNVRGARCTSTFNDAGELIMHTTQTSWGIGVNMVEMDEEEDDDDL